MANYENFKSRAKSTFSAIADASVEAYRVSNEKAKILAKKAKLNAGIANERATIRRLNVEIGATYYKLNKDNPDEALKTQVEDITAAYARIATKQAELEELKSPAQPQEPNTDGDAQEAASDASEDIKD